MALFLGPLFILRAHQSLVPSVGMLPSGYAMLCPMLTCVPCTQSQVLYIWGHALILSTDFEHTWHSTPRCLPDATAEVSVLYVYVPRCSDCRRQTPTRRIFLYRFYILTKLLSIL
jgi:hypothetical protein